MQPEPPRTSSPPAKGRSNCQDPTSPRSHLIQSANSEEPATSTRVSPGKVKFAPSNSCLCCAPDVERVEKPASAYRSFILGDVNVHCLTDGGVTVAAEWVFNQRRNNATGQMEKWPQLSENDIADCFQGGRMPLSFGCTLLQSHGTNVILDTSLGSVDPPIMPAFTVSRPLLDLREVLNSLGLAPNDIHYVVHTHMHRDHTGWNVVKNDDGTLVPLFPKAKHVVQRAEWSYWKSSDALRDRIKFDQFFSPLEALDMMQIVDGNSVLCTGVSLQLAAGHTPGHQACRIEGEAHGLKKVAYFVGDALHTASQIQHPDWSPFFDWSPAMSALIRRDLLKQISKENALLLSPHFPFPGVGTVTGQDGSWQFKAVPSDSPEIDISPPPPKRIKSTESA